MLLYQEAESPAATTIVGGSEENHYQFETLGVRVVDMSVGGEERPSAFAAGSGLRRVSAHLPPDGHAHVVLEAAREVWG